MNNICKKCVELKNKNCKGMKEFYSGCIYYRKDIENNKKGKKFSGKREA